MAKDKDELFAETPTKKLTAEEQLKEDARKQVEEELKQKKEDSGDHTFTANKIFEDELVKERLKAGLLVRRYVDREITINSTLYSGDEIVSPEIAADLDAMMSKARREHASHNNKRKFSGTMELSSAGQVVVSNPASRVGN